MAISDIDWTLTKDFFSVVGTVVSALGVGLAFYVGLAGLATWRRQLKGASDHELSRKALVELYRYRDAMDQARAPGMLEWECQLTAEEKAGLTFVQKNHLELRKGYQRRLEQIRKVREPLYMTLLDCEAVWGKDLQSLFRSLFKLQNEFSRYIELHLIASDPREDEEDRRPYRDILKGRRDVMYSGGAGKEDEFKMEFDKASAAVETYLKNKLIK